MRAMLAAATICASGLAIAMPANGSSLSDLKLVTNAVSDDIASLADRRNLADTELWAVSDVLTNFESISVLTKMKIDDDVFPMTADIPVSTIAIQDHREEFGRITFQRNNDTRCIRESSTDKSLNWEGSYIKRTSGYSFVDTGKHYEQLVQHFALLKAICSQ